MKFSVIILVAAIHLISYVNTVSSIYTCYVFIHGSKRIYL